MGVEKIKRPLLAENQFSAEELGVIQRALGLGYGIYADAAARDEVNGVVIPANTRTKLTIDALHPQTYIAYENGMIGWDPVTNSQPVDVESSAFDWRFTFSVKKNAVATDQSLTFEQDIGGSVGVIFGQTELLTKGQGFEQAISFGWPGYGRDTFKANGGSFYVTSTAAITLWKKTFFVSRVPSCQLRG